MRRCWWSRRWSAGVGERLVRSVGRRAGRGAGGAAGGVLGWGSGWCDPWGGVLVEGVVEPPVAGWGAGADGAIRGAACWSRGPVEPPVACWGAGADGAIR